MMRPVRKAVFPIAGLGTRFLPATKAMPKEMLTVVDKPLIQYAVEEALAAGIEQIIFVTGRNKGAIDDHFDIAYELESIMRARGKSLDVLTRIRMTPGNPVYVRQQEPLGLGHAVWCAREIVGDEPFAVLLPDELMVGTPGFLAQMIQAYDKVGGNLVGALAIDPDETANYGIIAPGTTKGAITTVAALVEKPPRGSAPSNLMIPGRYILQPEIMAILGRQTAGAGGEIQLTDAIARLIGRQPVHGVTFTGQRYDCGDKAQFIEANVALALARHDIGDAVRDRIERALDATPRPDAALAQAHDRAGRNGIFEAAQAHTGLHHRRGFPDEPMIVVPR